MSSLTSQRLGILAVVAGLAIVPWVFGSFTVSLFNDIGMAALVVLGLVLLSGVAGVISFGHAAFVGIAAYASAWLSTEYAISPWFGLPFALGVTALSALVIGALTLRLGGHYLPLSTIAWGLVVPLLFGNMAMLGRHSGISDIAPLSLGDWQLMTAESAFYIIWILVGLVATFCYHLLNSRMGRAVRAVRGGNVLLASFGANIFHVRLMLFVLSAVFAALAGWLYAHTNRFVSPAPFSLHVSIDYMFMMVVGGMTQLTGALAGATIVIAVKNVLQDLLPLVSRHAAQIQAVAFSTLFILLLHHARGGILSLASKMARVKTPAPTQMHDAEPPVEPLPRRSLPDKGQPLLSVEAATKRFKGLVAVNEVSFHVKSGEMVGLIGPNGAGKSTMFNLMTGTLQLSSGRTEFMGENITRRSQRDIALMGMARTFQHVKLRPQMSVLDNVALGAHARGQCGMLRAGFNLDTEEERRIHAEARRQIARIGLEGQEMEAAGNMPLGTQRLIEIARALAADPVLLILDEPAAGLRKAEKQALADLLSRLRKEGVTIMIVEHDMDFVMKLVDRLIVMNFGTKLFEGDPQAARADLGVREAYLGHAA
ncbi:branched-chain amino acid transport system permease protein [Salinihabitans flavidus]|uniref:Branched-chain amino acid transport system permease protein n=1 Tax=Salinihabitans flavidus TaxID=569882 RepID=A0A1H8UMK8_9RHOB|nr:branched-chain amino acid ABC transporter ATP-binding protein/permease [Salinihabitans flavidus]SEP04213.1 branched-chain amino acid transport system permease protein [Salinihabitans flavidus]